MNLDAVVKKYLSLAGSYGNVVALSDFGLDRAATERTFSAFDEDYQISRFFHFTKSAGTAYRLNGFEHTHVSVDAEIQAIL